LVERMGRARLETVAEEQSNDEGDHPMDKTRPERREM
jgi:hypothetical protein